MEFEVLNTERLLLRKITPEGIKYLFQNYSEEEVKRQLGLSTENELIKEREKSIGGYTTYDRSILQFKLILKDTEEVIGSCGFHNWYFAHRKAELGYAISKEEHKMKGYMSEAVNEIIEYGFASMNLNRIEACVGPDNLASLSLIKKFGFVKEGYLRQHYISDGHIYDSVVFSLLKEEYRGKRNNNQ